MMDTTKKLAMLAILVVPASLLAQTALAMVIPAGLDRAMPGRTASPRSCKHKPRRGSNQGHTGSWVDAAEAG